MPQLMVRRNMHIALRNHENVMMLEQLEERAALPGRQAVSPGRGI
jgi:hypothetical protein